MPPSTTSLARASIARIVGRPLVRFAVLATASIVTTAAAATVAWQPDAPTSPAGAGAAREVHAAGVADPQLLAQLEQLAPITAEPSPRPAAAPDRAKLERNAVKPKPKPKVPAVPGGSVWDRLARCESGGNWAASGGLYEGGLQFHPSTWDRYRSPGMPGAAYEASREEQIAVAQRVQAAQGWDAWPSCSRKLGLS